MPPIFTLLLRNGLTNKVRTALTILVIAVAVIAFGVLRTAVRSYYLGVEASAPDRLIVRHKVSLMFQLPLSYRDRISQVSGVEAAAWANWFGGYYQDQKQFFAQFAINDGFLDLYPEFLLTPEERKSFLSERSACIVGEKIAAKYGWKLGDKIVLTGTIYPGDWEFTVRGIYRGRDRSTDRTTMMFRWEYLNEWIKANAGDGQDQAGWYVIKLADPGAAARISRDVDAAFADGTAQTITETEKAFQMSFVQMAGAIVVAIEVISYIVVVIVLMVMANTMTMCARERISQYAVMKTVGFRTPHLVGVITGEAMTIAMAGAGLGLVLGYPLITGFGKALEENMGAFFPVFELSPFTAIQAVGLCLLCGAAAAVFPLAAAVRTPIATALRKVN